MHKVAAILCIMSYVIFLVFIKKAVSCNDENIYLNDQTKRSLCSLPR